MIKNLMALSRDGGAWLEKSDYWGVLLKGASCSSFLSPFVPSPPPPLFPVHISTVCHCISHFVLPNAPCHGVLSHWNPEAVGPSEQSLRDSLSQINSKIHPPSEIDYL